MISVSSKNGKHHVVIFKLKKCQNILENIIHIENISLEIVRNTHNSGRIVSRHHRSNQKPYLEEGQTTQSPKGTCLVGLVYGFNRSEERLKLKSFYYYVFPVFLVNVL
jgi:hypothetical protein